MMGDYKKACAASAQESREERRKVPGSLERYCVSCGRKTDMTRIVSDRIDETITNRAELFVVRTGDDENGHMKFVQPVPQ